jgi:hypothetical protein
MGLEDLDRLEAAFAKAEPAKSGGDYTPIPEDTRVKLVVINQKPAIVGAKQTPVCKITCEVVEPPQYAAKKIWHDFWLTEANAKYLKRDLIVLGWPGLTPEGKLVQGYRVTQLLQPNDNSLINLGAEVTVGIEEYSAVNQQTGAEERRVKNTIKFFNSTYKYSGPPKQKPAEAGTPPPPSDDDLPF